MALNAKGEGWSMSEIPADLVAKMMVKCARRCCICRRFRPTRLQVHHIVERNQGGGNEEANLIVICQTCHSDVHTKVPFSRRFSIDELRGHRDALVKMVEEGKLPSNDTDDTDQVLQRVSDQIQSGETSSVELSAAAVDLLLNAVNCTNNRAGMIIMSETLGGTSFQAGDFCPITRSDRREEARYKQGLSQLENCELIEGGPVYQVTYDGYLAADQIATSQSDQAD